MSPASDFCRLYVPSVGKGRDRANAPRRSAAGLLTLVGNRHPFAGFPSSVGKAVGGSVLAVLRSRPWLFHGASASIGHRTRAPFVEEGGPGGGGKRARPSPATSQDAPGATRATSDDPTVDRVSSSRCPSQSSYGIPVSGRCDFMRYRADVAEGGMPATTVVEDFDVLEDRSAGLGATDVVVSVDEFRLERREEALRDGVIPAIALTAHAAEKAVGLQQTPVRI